MKTLKIYVTDHNYEQVDNIISFLGFGYNEIKKSQNRIGRYVTMTVYDLTFVYPNYQEAVIACVRATIPSTCWGFRN